MESGDRARVAQPDPGGQHNQGGSATRAASIIRVAQPNQGRNALGRERKVEVDALQTLALYFLLGFRAKSG